MHLSVIVPILGSAAKLNRFLNGVLHQRLDRSVFDVIVIDDGSTQGLADVVRDCERRFDNGQITYIRNDVNQGRAKARNRGIAVATGDVLLFVDVDNVPDPDAFGVIVDHFAGCECRAVRGNVRCKIDDVDSSAYIHFFDQRYLGARGVVTGPLSYRYFASDALAISREALDRVGMFDEQFHAYGCEDEELGCRVKANGIPFYFVTDARFEDMDRPTLGREADRMREYSCYSLPLLLVKHPAYAAECLFPHLEAARGIGGTLRRWVLISLLNWAVANRVMRVLDFLDSRVPRIPAHLFYYVIASAYVAGYRNRRP